MGKEHFIQGKGDNGHHDGRRSMVRRLQSSLDQMRAYTQERISAHEQGHTPPIPFAGTREQTELLFPDEGIVGGFYPEGRGQEIELFDPDRADTRSPYTPDSVWTPTDLNDPP